MKRRNLLGKLGTAGTVFLAGCTTLLEPESETDTSTPTPRDTDASTETETYTKTPNLLEQTHSAGDLDGVVQELEQDSATLNLQPADTNAEYANSVIFEQYNGELNVELDLGQALNQRRFEHPLTQEPIIREFYENAHREEWRQTIHDQYIEAGDGENILQLKEEIAWNLYQNGANLDERIEESGVQELWFKYAIANPDIDGISSVHNGIKAAAYQKLDREHGFNTFYWSHDSLGENGDHGLIAATENPTRNQEETSEQENYTIETNPGVEQQIAEVAESNYFNGDNAGANGYVEHPAEQDYNNVGKESAMYGFTGMIKSGSPDLWDRAANFPDSLAHHFTDEWFHNPSSEPAFNHFDRMNTAAYLAEANNGRLHHTENELQFEAYG